MPDMTMIEKVARAICNQFTGSETWADTTEPIYGEIR